ncbi:MAG: hemolysin family protein [Gemmatimonadota bacterium]
MEHPPSGIALPGLVLILALVVANAFFVAAEFALVGARRTRLEEMIRAGDRKAGLALKAIESLRRYISATQIGITMCSLGLGWVGEPTLARAIQTMFSWLPPTAQAIATHSVAVAIAFALITILHIVLGELVPKAVAIAFPEHSSRWLTPPLMGFAWVMRGPAWLLNGMATQLVRLVGIKDAGEHSRLHSPEEIRILVEQSEEGGSLGQEDARLLEGVFEFSEKTAEDVMTPRTEIVALEASLTVSQAAAIVAEAGRSRYPVHHDSLDEIIGIVHAKDILRNLLSEKDSSVGTIVRPPLFVPGTKEVEDVLVDMKRLKVHMAIVLDEYGGTAGLVTMEDLLEEIVGPIFDEHDRPEPAPPPSESTVIDGSMPIGQYNAEYGTELDDTDYTTLGGYLFGQLGRLPQVGDRVALGNRMLEIAAMDGRRVKSVRVVPEVAQVEERKGEGLRA